MPIIQGKSKKAFNKNVEAEMKSGKPQDQALAIAYSIQRKNKRKKMFDGGEVWNRIKSEIAGVADAIKKGGSGYSTAKEIDDRRKKGLPAEIDMPKTKPEPDTAWTPYAKGGEVKSKIQKLKNPRIIRGAGFNSKLRDQEEDQAPLMAESGSIEHAEALEKAAELVEHEVESIREEEGIEEPKEEQEMAHGGIAHEMMDVPEEEAAEEDHASIAAAIMAKQARKSALDSDSDIDEQMRMYEGGQIEGSNHGEADLNLNSMEQPNKYYPRNEDEVLKENYDEDFIDLSQPIDSNELGDAREAQAENEHDQSIISRIRAKMANKRFK